MTVVETCAAFATEPNPAMAGADVIHHAKRAVIDWFAALVPGAVVAPATALEKALAEDIGRGPAHLADGRPATARTAALINGTASHTVEVDDIFRDGIYHPGAPTIPAALAASEEMDANGAAFLRAVIIGYEISTRIGAAMGRAHYKYWHNTGTVGTFGAAAAASAAYRLDRAQFAHALATSGTFAAALQQAFRHESMSKPLHAGRAAEAGMLAALAARHGVTGSLDVIDGEAGFGVAMGEDPDWTKAFKTLGTSFNIAQMTFKNHACCGHTFAAIDGAQAALERLGANARDIERVDVATYRPALDVAGFEDPKTPAEARFSLKYVVARALVAGSVRLAASTPAAYNDPPTRDLMRRMSLSVDAKHDADFPGARAATVTITLRDGRTATHVQPTRKGDPELPLTDRDLDSKFLELASPVLGQPRARALLSNLWSLEAAGSMRATMAALAR